MNATGFPPRPAFRTALAGGPALALLLVFLCGPSSSPAVEGSFPGGAGRENPHKEIPCAACHTRIPEKGKTSWEKIAAGLVKDPVGLCRECHAIAEADHHPVLLRTERPLSEGLPLSPDGEVVCSTCHDVHLKGAGVSLLRGFDTGRYAVRMDMCLDCHGKSFGEINPHRVGGESEHCYTCHAAVPGTEDTSATVSFQRDILAICNFCHNVREKAHPLNVDPLRKLPSSLPRGKGGEATCGTCHDPHGSEGRLHFLRKPYMEFLEAGRYQNPHGGTDYRSCQGCHIEVSPRKEEMRRTLRYGGDDLQICLSCHGAMDACHPILVKPASWMKQGADLPLTADGKITCLTCHDPMHAGGRGVVLRGREPGDPINAICFRCHDKQDLASRNPHTSMGDRGSCKFCHDTMTDPTDEEAARVSFISNTRLICLRCHAQEVHPSAADHMVAPRMTIPEPFHLDGKGKITCTTCHNPHIDTRTPEGGERRRRFVVEGDTSSLCSRCHGR